MKTRIKKLFLLAIILLTPNLVTAASSCTYEQQAELNDIVANVKASYEVVDIYNGKVYDVDNPNSDGTFLEKDHYIKGFNVSILNITNDIYVRVSNNKNKEVKTYHYADTVDGTATFQTTEVESLITYTIEVFANKYSCVGEKLRELSITTPLYNNYSERLDCKDNTDFYYCQEFIPSENIPYNEFKTKMNEYKTQKVEEEEKRKEENKSFLDKLKEFYNNYTVAIYIVGAVIIVAGVATTVILVKKKRSRVL